LDPAVINLVLAKRIPLPALLCWRKGHEDVSGEARSYTPEFQGHEAVVCRWGQQQRHSTEYREEQHVEALAGRGSPMTSSMVRMWATGNPPLAMRNCR